MIPNYQKFMLPVLRILGDGKDRTPKDCIEKMCQHFGFSEEEKVQMLPSGRQSIVHNRTQWAIFYMKKAGLTETPKRGIYRITNEGKRVLTLGLTELSTKYLQTNYPVFAEFYHPKTKAEASEPNEEIEDADTKTPDERMGDAFKAINDQLAEGLLDKILKQSPQYFETLVVSLLEKMGYGNGRITPYTNDEGIDGVINEDKLGLDKIYIQAKKWDKGNPVGAPEVQKFIGALSSHGGTKGVFITTATFSKKALELSPSNIKLVLIDGLQLANLMIQYNLGVSTYHVYEMKKIDNDFFDEV